MKNSMLMNCSEVQGELPLYVGGDLEVPTNERVARHLKSCAVCSGVLDSIDEARVARLEHFESVADSGPSTSLWPGLRESLLAEGLIQGAEPAVHELTPQPSPPVQAPLSAAGRLLRFLPMAAAAAGLFFLGTLFQGTLFQGEGPGGGVNSTGGVVPAMVMDQSPTNDVQPIESTPASNGLARGEMLQPVERGSSLQPAGSAAEILSRRAQPFLGETVQPFNALRPIQGLNNAASLRQHGNGMSCDGVR